jgi:hypothetical protein
MRGQETRRAGPFFNEPFVPRTAWPKPERIIRLLSDHRITMGRQSRISEPFAPLRHNVSDLALFPTRWARVEVICSVQLVNSHGGS